MTESHIIQRGVHTFCVKKECHPILDSGSWGGGGGGGGLRWSHSSGAWHELSVLEL